VRTGEGPRESRDGGGEFNQGLERPVLSSATDGVAVWCGGGWPGEGAVGGRAEGARIARASPVEPQTTVVGVEGATWSSDKRRTAAGGARTKRCGLSARGPTDLDREDRS
jgi:hypothetical protein